MKLCYPIMYCLQNCLWASLKSWFSFFLYSSFISLHMVNGRNRLEQSNYIFCSFQNCEALSTCISQSYFASSLKAYNSFKQGMRNSFPHYFVLWESLILPFEHWSCEHFYSGLVEQYCSPILCLSLCQH